MKVAVPSYLRQTILRDETLKMLLDAGFDPKDIYIFLSSEEELVKYKAVIDTPLNWVITDAKSEPEKREWIRRYFPIGTEVLTIDDDVKRVKFLPGKEMPLKQFCERMFAICKEENLTLWGIYPVNQTNMFYCKDRLMKGSFYCVFCFLGFVNVEQEPFPANNYKSDKWLNCMRIKRDGAILRYEGACPDTVYFNRKGGIFDERTIEKEESSSRALAEMFPEIVRYKMKANGHPNVEFIRKKNTILNHSLRQESQPSPPSG